MVALFAKRLALPALLLGTVCLLIIQRPTIGPMFDALLYGYLLQLFAEGTHGNITEPELFLLMVNPSTGPVFYQIFSVVLSSLGYQLEKLTLAPLLVNSFLLSILLWRIHLAFERHNMAVYLSAAIILSLMLHDTRWLLFLLGDAPSLLISIIACSFIIDPKLSITKKHILFTFTACLALYTRLTCLPLIAGAALYLVGQTWLHYRDNNPIQALLKQGFINLTIAASIYLFITLIEYALVYSHHKQYYFELFKIHIDFLSDNQNTRIIRGENLVQSIQLIIESAQKNYALLNSFYETRFGFKLHLWQLTALIITALIATRKKAITKNPLFPALLLFSTMTFFQGLWFFSAPELLYNRYTYQLGTLLSLSSILATIIISPKLFGFTLISLLTSFFVYQGSINGDLPYSEHYKQQKLQAAQGTAETLALSSFLSSQTDAMISYVKIQNTSFPMPVNYLLPDKNHIQGVEAWLNNQVINKTTRPQWSDKLNDALLVTDRLFWRNMKFKKQNLAFQNRLHRACRTEAYQNTYYRVLHCKAEDIRHEFTPQEIANWQLPVYAW